MQGFYHIIHELCKKYLISEFEIFQFSVEGNYGIVICHLNVFTNEDGNGVSCTNYS